MQGRRKVEGVCGEQGGGDRREVGGSSQIWGAGALDGGGGGGGERLPGEIRLLVSTREGFILKAVNHPVREKTEAGSSMAHSRRSQY